MIFFYYLFIARNKNLEIQYKTKKKDRRTSESSEYEKLDKNQKEYRNKLREKMVCMNTNIYSIIYIHERAPDKWANCEKLGKGTNFCIFFFL